MAFFKNLKTKLFGQKTTKYDQGLKKSRILFASKIKALAARYHQLDEQYFEELTEVLILADVGYKMAETITDEIRHEAKIQKLTKPKDINDIIIDKMFVIYTDGQLVSTRLNFSSNNISLFLVVGVNGNGKTTSAAKLAAKLKIQGKKPILVAADTFRAGAVEQLQIWAERIGIPCYLGTPKQDPASVVYAGIEAAKSEGCDVIIVDTAGRLENKVNLMQELKKINKIITQKLGHEANETLLVIDGTTGQNGINQAQEFMKIVSLTGIILTKMDGTAKGGIILAIKEELDIPVKLMGFGEGINDLEEFDLDKYIFSLTSDLFVEYENE
ncbi:signal recognition particle-docking protein FtsY [Spiroplasma endosymbiont of Melieria omissa]|uniref:signal recognition particle-docking protein FtsY n=1 Tax=Spiroplasma endosymbiont of Melieria omissa TaxID=3139324 RepID=UPI003CCB5E15